MVAQAQERFAEAEASYRTALDIYRESDLRAAPSTATNLGIVQAALGRHGEAVRTLLYAVVTWQQQTGQWAEQDLQWLHRERALIEPSEFTALIKTTVPADVADDLMAAVGEAADPTDIDDQ